MTEHKPITDEEIDNALSYTPALESPGGLLYLRYAQTLKDERAVSEGQLDALRAVYACDKELKHSACTPEELNLLKDWRYYQKLVFEGIPHVTFHDPERARALVAEVLGDD